MCVYVYMCVYIYIYIYLYTTPDVPARCSKSCRRTPGRSGRTRLLGRLMFNNNIVMITLIIIILIITITTIHNHTTTSTTTTTTTTNNNDNNKHDNHAEIAIRIHIRSLVLDAEPNAGQSFRNLRSCIILFLRRGRAGPSKVINVSPILGAYIRTRPMIVPSAVVAAPFAITCV